MDAFLFEEKAVQSDAGLGETFMFYSN